MKDATVNADKTAAKDAKIAAKLAAKAVNDAAKAEKKAAKAEKKVAAQSRYTSLDYESKVEIVANKYAALLDVAADKPAAIDEIIKTTNKAGWIRMMMGDNE